jgi:hypothetical protein
METLRLDTASAAEADAVLHALKARDDVVYAEREKSRGAC